MSKAAGTFIAVRPEIVRHPTKAIASFAKGSTWHHGLTKALVDYPPPSQSYLPLRRDTNISDDSWQPTKDTIGRFD